MCDSWKLFQERINFYAKDKEIPEAISQVVVPFMVNLLVADDRALRKMMALMQVMRRVASRKSRDKEK